MEFGEVAENEAILYINEFFIHFYEGYDLLISRFNRLFELQKSREWDIDCETFLDMIVVQLRSLLLDKREGVLGNYTAQNALSFMEDGEGKLELIQHMLDTTMIPGANSCCECLVRDDECLNYDRDNCKVKESLKLSDAIKIIADKSLCHYDNYHRKGSHKWELIQILKNMLIDEGEKVNLRHIVETLEGVFGDGVQ